MRGAQWYEGDTAPDLGIIPAYAGSTSPTPSRPPSTGDHPRVCGEHHRNTEPPGRGKGSSPRMRGAHGPCWPCRRGAGIIPAYVGSTSILLWSICREKDHPRVCGEHPAMATIVPPWRGSSPRMRGAPVDFRESSPMRGIIPADAGSTWIARPGIACR